MNEKIWRKQFLFAKPKILTLWCLAYCGVEFFELCDQIARQNRNRIRKRLSLFTRGPDVFEAWKNGGRKCRDALPLTAYASNFLQIILYLRGLSSRMGRFYPFSNFMHLQVVWGFPRYSPYCIQYGEIPQKFILFQKHRRATPLKGPYLNKNPISRCTQYVNEFVKSYVSSSLVSSFSTQYLVDPSGWSMGWALHVRTQVSVFTSCFFNPNPHWCGPIYDPSNFKRPVA